MLEEDERGGREGGERGERGKSFFVKKSIYRYMMYYIS